MHDYFLVTSTKCSERFLVAAVLEQVIGNWLTRCVPHWVADRKKRGLRLRRMGSWIEIAACQFFVLVLGNIDD